MLRVSPCILYQWGAGIRLSVKKILKRTTTNNPLVKVRLQSQFPPTQRGTNKAISIGENAVGFELVKALWRERERAAADFLHVRARWATNLSYTCALCLPVSQSVDGYGYGGVYKIRLLIRCRTVFATIQLCVPKGREGTRWKARKFCRERRTHLYLHF